MKIWCGATCFINKVCFSGRLPSIALVCFIEAGKPSNLVRCSPWCGPEERAKQFLTLRIPAWNVVFSSVSWDLLATT